MWRGWLVLGFVVAGCGGRATPEVPPEAVLDGPARVELLGDVQHLLGEAVGAHGAGDRVAALRAWDAAYRRFHDHLVRHVRARDPGEALALEYRLGRLRDALAGPRGRPGPAFEALDRELASLRSLLEGAEAPAEGATREP